MKIMHVTNGVKVTTTCRIYKTGRIIIFCPVTDLYCFELTPAFIKRHPYHNGWKWSEGIYHGFQFCSEYFLRRIGPVFINWLERRIGDPFVRTEIHITTGHVL